MKLIKVKCKDSSASSAAIELLSGRINEAGIHEREEIAKVAWNYVKNKLSPNDKEEVKAFLHSIFKSSNWWNS